MPLRIAVPGAIKVPPGSRDRERLQALEDLVAAMARDIKELKKANASTPEGSPDKAPLVARAHELGLGAPSQLNRWSVEKLQSSIAEAEK